MASQPDSGGRESNLRGRVKFPDDPDIRVELSENFRAALSQRDPTEIAEELAALPGGVRLHPSSIVRYAQGKIAPKLSVARKLAKVLDWPLTEVVAGYARRHGRPTLDWGRVLLYARTFRDRAADFLEMFRALIVPNTHFGFPNDRERGWRRQVRPRCDGFGYACFEVELDSAPSSDVPIELVVSYCLFERPRVFIDFGRITVSPGELRSVEIWTRRQARVDMSDGEKRFWVATWIDGKAVDFVIRCRWPFSVSPTMVPEAELPVGARSVVRFRPGPIHKYDLAERSDAGSAP